MESNCECRRSKQLAVRVWVIRSMLKRETAQAAGKGPKMMTLWKRMWGRTDK